MKKLILVILLLTMLSGCGTCVTKDPHDYVPGWQDNRLEFGKSYYKLRIIDVYGNWTQYEFTHPGWYGTHDGSYIDYVIMCK